MLRFLPVFAFAALLIAAPARAETYRLNYRAEVLGVVVLGAVSYEVTANATRYAARANVRTSGLARMFDQTEISAAATGAITGTTISWARYDISHAYAGKFRRIRLDRGDAGVTASIEPGYGDMGTPPASAAQQRASYDPLTAIFALGRQVGGARACTGSVLVFDGRQHYRLALSAHAAGTFNGGGYNGPAISCTFRYEPISGFSDNLNRARIPVAQAWFALPDQPGFAPPLRLSVPTPVGEARLEIHGYQRLS